MKKLIAITALAFSPLALAGPECTTSDVSEWMDQEQFQSSLKEAGYKIKKFKVTDGNCYEIYGWNQEGQKVEIYFDPVSGNPVKTKVED